MKKSSTSHPTNFRLASHVGSACAFCIVLLALSPSLAIAQNDTAPPIDPPSPSPIRIARLAITEARIASASISDAIEQASALKAILTASARLGDLDSSMATASQVIMLAPRMPQQADGVNPVHLASAAQAMAMSHAYLGSIDDAVELAESLEMDDKADALALIAVALGQREQLEDASRFIQKAREVEHGSDSPEWRDRDLALALVLAGSPDHVLRQSLSDKWYVRPFISIARAYIRDGRVSEAKEVLLRVEERASKDDDANEGVGHLIDVADEYRRLGWLQREETVLRQAREVIDGSSTVSAYKRVAVFVRTGDHEKARELAAGNRLELWRYVTERARLGFFEDAIVTARTIPVNATKHYALADVARELHFAGRNQEADELFAEAFEADTRSELSPCTEAGLTGRMGMVFQRLADCSPSQRASVWTSIAAAALDAAGYPDSM